MEPKLKPQDDMTWLKECGDSNPNGAAQCTKQRYHGGRHAAMKAEWPGPFAAVKGHGGKPCGTWPCANVPRNKKTEVVGHAANS